MAELDLDLEPNGDAFEAAYALPADLPENMRALHDEIITSLRNEARAVSVGTHVKMLIERMAWFYVSMKHRELNAAEPMSVREQTDMLTFYLKMSEQYTKLITSAESKSRQALLESIMDILDESLSLLDGQPEKKRQFEELWRPKFAELGL